MDFVTATQFFFKNAKKNIAIFAQVCVPIDEITLYNDPLGKKR
jgi:hypothetical protein